MRHFRTSSIAEADSGSCKGVNGKTWSFYLLRNASWKGERQQTLPPPAQAALLPPDARPHHRTPFLPTARMDKRLYQPRRTMIF